MYFKIFNLLILSSLQLFLFNYIKIKIYFHKKGNRLNFTKKNVIVVIKKIIDVFF
jgi:hypothetical protein